jgi:ferrochelatase
MYPQYSGSTTGAIYDQISNIIKESRDVPDISIVKSYSTHSGYIDSLANKIKNHWDKYGKNEKLLMSFHGIPQEYTDKGDPYGSHCLSTAEALAEKLSLKDTEWSMGFQSRFGPKKWLQPYIDDQLNDCIKEGIKSIDIISPAFTADCLETLEELNIGYRELFLSAGGENYSYIPCVNDSSLFIKALADIIDTRLY